VPNTLDIRRRIRSVKNTQQITKAMKMVSAAKLRRAQDRMLAARPYSAALRQVLASVASRIEGVAHPLLEVRPENRVVLVVVTGDKGLAGAFNTNITRTAQTVMHDHRWQDVQLVLVGRKANDFFRRRPTPIRHSVVNIFQALDLAHAQELTSILIDDYVNDRIDAVYIVFNEFKSVIQQTVRLEKLLPIGRISADEAPGEIDYIYEPGPQQILNELLPKYLEFQIYRALLESLAAEHGARMTAMESATKNASEMIDSLTLTYNRIRQAAITKEIIEIVSGAAALG
jgi:F-type H+-transporting ATPase subunit gamma